MAMQLVDCANTVEIPANSIKTVATKQLRMARRGLFAPPRVFTKQKSVLHKEVIFEMIIEVVLIETSVAMC
jgi:hypothetical protein